MQAAVATSPTLGDQIAFWILAVCIVAGALLTITRKNPVTAVMSLVGTFFALAALYTTLDAHFLAILQVLVYAGAIMVLFIFVVMSINREEVTPIALRGLFWRLLGVVGSGYLVYIFVKVVARVPQAGARATVPETFGSVASIGDLLFREFVYPFEAISLLLLVAIVGGLVVSRSHRKEIAAEAAAERRRTIQHLSARYQHPGIPGTDEGEGHTPHAGGHH